mgnify:FL=1|tara:strand:- start:1394 stop:2281 length:888 start_codon:yes stop_codon:yes gene_type:complete
MAEQVELDMDDAQEKTVEVNEKPKVATEDTPTVDLGYTDHDTGTAKVKVEEEPKDDLTEISGNVQKRIDKLTRNWRESQRREQAALDYAKGLQQKYADIEKNYSAVDENYVKEYDARVDAEREQVKKSLQEAIEAQDSKKIMEANDQLTKLAVEKEKARIKIQQKETQKEEQKKQPTQEQIQQPAQPSPRAQEWAGDNEWFGKDKAMTNAAFGIHEDLIQKGFDAESEEYYAEVDKQMRGYFPNKFVDETKPVQTVASAGRKQQGRKTVRLTRSQVAIAQKLGVPLEEYAKYVKG